MQDLILQVSVMLDYNEIIMFWLINGQEKVLLDQLTLLPLVFGGTPDQRI